MIEPNIPIINPFARREVPDHVKFYIVKLMPLIRELESYDHVKGQAWFFSENPGLGFKMPIDLIDLGQGPVVESFLVDALKRKYDKARIEDKLRAERELAARQGRAV